MKRIAAAIFMLLILFLHTPAVLAKSFDIQGDYSFYTKTYYGDANCRTVQNGDVFVVSCPSEYADSLRPKLVGILGESVRTEGGVDDCLEIARATGKVYFTQNADGVFVAEGFSPKLSGGVVKDGVKVNFQAACRDGVITVGTPLILGSF